MSAQEKRRAPTGCVSLVGMAGAGKSTLGRLLAAELGWEQVDTDHLIEAYYGIELQEVMDTFGLDRFLEIEDYLVSGLGVDRTVVSTGGSVVYGKNAVARLKELGAVIHLHVELPTFLERVGDGQGRGLAIAPGKTMADLYAERAPLYAAAADLVVDTGGNSPKQCVDTIVRWLRETGRVAEQQAQGQQGQGRRSACDNDPSGQGSRHRGH